MTLKDSWDKYTSNIKSPQKFLDLGFYWMIGAALQRRVWLGPYLKPIVPNLYVILCAEPGIGKGLVIDDIAGLMKHHKLKTHVNKDDNKIEEAITKAEKEGATSDTLVLLRQSKEAMESIKNLQSSNSQKTIQEQLLFPCGADATTYESLIQQHASAIRVFHCKGPTSMAPSGLYSYHSLNFIVEEASSLFRKHAETLVQYLLSAYNCSDYTYKTKHFGSDVIKRCSLALLGGTTPDFMRTAFTTQLLGEGFTSRTIFVFGAKNRFEGWQIPDYTTEQLGCRERILIRLKELSNYFGQCTLSEDATKYMDEYFIKIFPQMSRNKDPRLKYYYSRKALHAQKLALCIHFADNDTYEVQQSSLEESLKILGEVEETMHFCLSTKGDNPLGDLQRRILKWLIYEKGSRTFVDIYVNFVDDANEEGIEEAIKFLLYCDKIEQSGDRYNVKQKV